MSDKDFRNDGSEGEDKMALDMKAALRKISEAQVNGGGNYIRGGTHLLELSTVLFEQKRDGVLCFIPELIVRESNATHLDHDGKEIAPHKAGETVSMVVKFAGSGLDMAGVNVKAFVCGLFGMDPNTVTEDELETYLIGGDVAETDAAGNPTGKKVFEPGISHKSQPARGMLIKCVGVPILTQKNKKPFVKLNWSPVAQTADEVRARRAAQEGKAAA